MCDKNFYYKCTVSILIQFNKILGKKFFIQKKNVRKAKKCTLSARSALSKIFSEVEPTYGAVAATTIRYGNFVPIFRAMVQPELKMLEGYIIT